MNFKEFLIDSNNLLSLKSNEPEDSIRMSLLGQDFETIVATYFPNDENARKVLLRKHKESIAQNLERSLKSINIFIQSLEKFYDINSCKNVLFTNGDRHLNGTRPIQFQIGDHSFIFKYRDGSLDNLASDLFKILGNPYKEQLIVQDGINYSIHNFIKDENIVTDIKRYSYNLGYRNALYAFLGASDLGYENVFILNNDIIPIDHEFLIQVPFSEILNRDISLHDFFKTSLIFNLHINESGKIKTSSMNTSKGMRLDLGTLSEGYNDCMRRISSLQKEIIDLIKDSKDKVVRVRMKNTMYYYNELKSSFILESLKERPEIIIFEIPHYHVQIDGKKIYDQEGSVIAETVHTPLESIMEKVPTPLDSNQIKELQVLNFFSGASQEISYETFFECLKNLAMNKIFENKDDFQKIDFYSGILGHIFYLDSFNRPDKLILTHKMKLWEKYITVIKEMIERKYDFTSFGFDLYILSKLSFINDYHDSLYPLLKHIIGIPLKDYKHADVLGGSSGMTLGLSKFVDSFSTLDITLFIERLKKEKLMTTQKSGLAHGTHGFSKVHGTPHNSEESNENLPLSWCKGKSGLKGLYQDSCDLMIAPSTIFQNSQCLCCGTSSLLFFKEDSLSEIVIKDLINELKNNLRLRLNSDLPHSDKSFMKGVIGISYALGVHLGLCKDKGILRLE